MINGIAVGPAFMASTGKRREKGTKKGAKRSSMVSRISRARSGNKGSSKVAKSAKVAKGVQIMAGDNASTLRSKGVAGPQSTGPMPRKRAELPRITHLGMKPQR